MNREDRYIIAIEQILQQIPQLERNLAKTCCENEKRSIEKSLKQREKRFEFLIPYKFRIELQNICHNLGVKGKFLD